MDTMWWDISWRETMMIDIGRDAKVDTAMAAIFGGDIVERDGLLGDFAGGEVSEGGGIGRF